jgi:hypothetical protein
MGALFAGMVYLGEMFDTLGMNDGLYDDRVYDDSDYSAMSEAELARALEDSFGQMSTFIDGQVAAGQPLPDDIVELYDRWDAVTPDASYPLDPYDGEWLGYLPLPEGGYQLWSSGPDGEPGTDDDISFQGGAGAGAERF